MNANTELLLVSYTTLAALLSALHLGPLAEFLGKKWLWGNPDKPIPHKAVYYASRACLGGHHPLHWVPRVHRRRWRARW